MGHVVTFAQIPIITAPVSNDPTALQFDDALVLVGSLRNDQLEILNQPGIEVRKTMGKVDVCTLILNNTAGQYNDSGSVRLLKQKDTLVVYLRRGASQAYTEVFNGFIVSLDPRSRDNETLKLVAHSNLALARGRTIFRRWEASEFSPVFVKDIAYDILEMSNTGLILVDENGATYRRGDGDHTSATITSDFVANGDFGLELLRGLASDHGMLLYQDDSLKLRFEAETSPLDLTSADITITKSNTPLLSTSFPASSIDKDFYNRVFVRISDNTLIAEQDQESIDRVGLFESQVFDRSWITDPTAGAAEAERILRESLDSVENISLTLLGNEKIRLGHTVSIDQATSGFASTTFYTIKDITHIYGRKFTTALSLNNVYFNTWENQRREDLLSRDRSASDLSIVIPVVATGRIAVTVEDGDIINWDTNRKYAQIGVDAFGYAVFG